MEINELGLKNFNENKIFYITIFFIILVLFISYYFILSPLYFSIKKERNEIKELIFKIKEAYNNIPNEFIKIKNLDNFIKNKKEKITNIYKSLVSDIDITNYINPIEFSKSIVEFRSECEKKYRILNIKANKLNIKLDKNLGFPHPLPSNISKKYWLELNLCYKILLYLLNLELEVKDNFNSIKKFKLYNINKIYYPNLEKNIIEKKFINKVDIEIIFSANFFFLMRFIYFISLYNSKNNKLFFLKIEKCKIDKIDKDKLKIDLFLTGIIINPEGEIEIKGNQIKENETTEEENKIPIWERY